MVYLSKDEIIAINRQVISRANEGTDAIQYPGGLDLIVKQPQMVAFGREFYPTIWLKAAYLLQKITKKHIFADGNKRTAYISTKLFLMKNGWHLVVTEQEGVALILGATIHKDDEQAMVSIADFLKRHSTKC